LHTIENDHANDRKCDGDNAGKKKCFHGMLLLRTHYPYNAIGVSEEAPSHSLRLCRAII
jgi:hypothetical protein